MEVKGCYLHRRCSPEESRVESGLVRGHVDGGRMVESMQRGREKGINKGINTYEHVINIGANLRNDPELTGADGCSWRPVLHAK